jgi:hypothetical protein
MNFRLCVHVATMALLSAIVGAAEEPYRRTKVESNVTMLKRNGDGSYELNGKRYPDRASLLRDHPEIATWGFGPVKSPEPPEPEPPIAGAPTDKERKDAAARALAYLAERIRHKGLRHPSSANGDVVTYALAGLAFLASGSTASSGPYSKEVAACVDCVIQNAGKIPPHIAKLDMNLDQTTWGYAHAILFLAELYAKEKAETTGQALRRFCNHLATIQTPEGSWCHSAKNEPNPLKYTVLNAVGNLCLTALGLARQAGVQVNSQTIEKGIQYLEDSIDDRGGVSYSTRPGQKGHGEVGRTCGSVLAFIALKRQGNPNFVKMKIYLLRHLHELESSHASPVLHILNGSLACTGLGKEAWDRYWKWWGRRILDLQRPDGSFAAPTESTSEGEDRATATQALALCLPEGRLTFLTPK